MTVSKPASELSLLEALDTPDVRPLVRSAVVYVVLWYSLYITAWVPTDPPQWALDWIEQLKPTFGAPQRASVSHTSDDPVRVRQ